MFHEPVPDLLWYNSVDFELTAYPHHSPRPRGVYSKYRDQIAISGQGLGILKV